MNQSQFKVHGDPPDSVPGHFTSVPYKEDVILVFDSHNIRHHLLADDRRSLCHQQLFHCASS